MIPNDSQKFNTQARMVYLMDGDKEDSAKAVYIVA